jgi:cytochrome c oxidase subunit 2
MFNQAFAGTLPLQGSEVAALWDGLYSFLVWLSVFFFILVVGGMVYFMFAYRHDPNKKTKYFTGSHLLEAIWIAVPTLLLLVIFAWGYVVYRNMVQAPSDAYEVRVIGKQWLWTFQYDNGRSTVGEFYVPMNRPVKLIMTSEDVLHSFFIPNFRVKQDVVPGMYSSVWFTATVPGKHQVYCAEYCGTSHSTMLAKVIVLDDAQWEAWNANKQLGEIPEAGFDQASNETDSIETHKASVSRAVSQVSLADQGKDVYRNKGCLGCHSVDGTTKVGPSHKGLFGRRLELADGRVVVADENFIRGHIENPRATTVKGFSPVMPTFKGLLSETELNALMAYIKSLK